MLTQFTDAYACAALGGELNFQQGMSPFPPLPVITETELTILVLYLIMKSQHLIWKSDTRTSTGALPSNKLQRFVPGGGGGGGGGGYSLYEGYYICSSVSTPLFQVSGKFVEFRPLYFSKNAENVVFWPLYFSKNEENVVFRPLFFIKIGQNV